jgi:hypothetical protein
MPIFMGENRKDDDAALMLFIAGLMIALAIIVLPFVWNFAKEGLAKQKVSVIVSEECTEGTSCQLCNQDGNKKVCVDGVCNANGDCLAPVQKNVTFKYPEKGLRQIANA